MDLCRFGKSAYLDLNSLARSQNQAANYNLLRAYRQAANGKKYFAVCCDLICSRPDHPLFPGCGCTIFHAFAGKVENN